jgi:hypothetical protein
MLNNFIHQIVHHYIWSPEQSHVAGDLKHSSIRCLLWREHEFLDALLNFPFCHFRVSDQYAAEILAFFAQELSYFSPLAAFP